VRGRAHFLSTAVLSLALVAPPWGVAGALAEEEPTSDSGVVISEPQFDPPSVVSPEPGDEVSMVQGQDGIWWWLLEVTNSDYQPDFDIDTGYVGFDTLPSVGIYDSIETRLEWTNQSFACFLDDSCDQLSLTPDQEAFGEDFVRLPKLVDPHTGTIAYHVEHAYEQGLEPYEWLVSQETLTLAMPWEPGPTGEVDIWVGYTYVYTDDLVGVPVTFTKEAMAITNTRVVIPTTPESGAIDSEDAPLEDVTPEDSGPAVPTWVTAAVAGLVGIVVFFGLLAFAVSRAVILARRRNGTNSGED